MIDACNDGLTTCARQSSCGNPVKAPSNGLPDDAIIRKTS